MTSCSDLEGKILTVKGPIPASDFGRSLAHEHIICDFIGAELADKNRYDTGEVIAVMAPYLNALTERGFRGFVDCTPAYIGRDVHVLQALSRQIGLHIVTNTGYYGAADDKYLPSHAFVEPAEKLAERWYSEWENGINGTAVRPGFVKIGVDGGHLSDIDKKLVIAAAMVHKKTGLTIACHTAETHAAIDVLNTVVMEGVSSSALIVAHADSIVDQEVHFELAKQGAWLEYDGITPSSIDKHVALICGIVEQNLTNRLLLSHDAGWYNVGDQGGGHIKPFTALWDTLYPALRAQGIDEGTLQKLIETNPGEAFSIENRTTT